MKEEVKYKKPELLIPAGDLVTLKVAVDYGADAVYIGGRQYGLRAKAGNFTNEEMLEGIKYAHENGVKVYVTVNIFAHNEDINGIRDYFHEIKDMGIDALIISDPGVFALAKKILPEMEIHISTQANNTNYMTYNFWHDMGANRVVAARELSLAEIKDIRKKTASDMEIEAFVHGAMCISYSGRCLLSSYFTGRDGNKGACTHPCRWKYTITEETRPGEYLPIEEDDRGTYIFNSKDLCMIEHIPELLDAGVYSFKIEGRMKTALYVAAVARTYRQAIDDCLVSQELYRGRLDYYKEEIAACTFRQFTTGFYFGKPTHETQIYDNNTYVKNYTFLGIIEELEKIPDGAAGDKTGAVAFVITQKNKFSVGDRVSIMDFGGQDAEFTVKYIYDEKMNPMVSAPHPKQKLYVVPEEWGDFLPAKGMVIRARHCEA